MTPTCCDPPDVAAGMLAPGSTALVVGEDGIVEALTNHGITVVPEGPADAVVVGLARTFTYDVLDRASAAVRSGARLVGTNEDATFPTPEGLVPGAGSLLAAVATASEATPEVAGKPHPPTAAAIKARVPEGELRAAVGDRPSTDGALAAQLGVPFGLVSQRSDPAGSKSGGHRRGGHGQGPDAAWSTRRSQEAEKGASECLLAASTLYTLVQWRVMSAFANTSMRAPCSGR